MYVQVIWPITVRKSKCAVTSQKKPKGSVLALVPSRLSSSCDTTRVIYNNVPIIQLSIMQDNHYFRK